jgi:hypothetical protein
MIFHSSVQVYHFSIFLGVAIYGHMGAHIEDKKVNMMQTNEGLSENMEPQNPVGDHHVLLNGHIWGTPSSNKIK